MVLPGSFGLCDIGRGVVEVACKNLIGARMKKSGMRWTINGGQAVLALRSLFASNRWEQSRAFFVNRHFPEFGTYYQAYTRCTLPGILNL